MRHGHGKGGQGRGRDGRLSCACALLVLSGPAAAQTRPGTVIENTAQLHYEVGGTTASGTSNTDRLTTAERLDVALAATGPATAGGWPLLLSNPGNGVEAFVIAATAGGQSRSVAIDADGDGRFDPAHDRLLDGATPSLAPGATLHLLVLGATDASDCAVEARAATGAGAPGTTFAGKGDGGGDAVVGPTGAAARLALAPVADTQTAPVFTKSQTVRAPDGSARPVSGAIVTYSLEARFGGPAGAASIDDPVPAGTRLVPGSLTLDGAALTDGADGDAGTADAGAVRVALGDISGPAVRRVQFQVQLQ